MKKLFILFSILTLSSSCESEILVGLFQQPLTDTGENKTSITDEKEVVVEYLELSNNMSASIVLGQSDFTSNQRNQDDTSIAKANSLSAAEGVFSDYKNDRLLIADRSNHRVLIYSTYPNINNQTADYVLGQPDLTSNSSNNGGRSAQSLGSPREVVWNGSELFVSDTANNRTLVWTGFPTGTHQPADFVYGQTDFTSGTSNSGGISASSIESFFAHSVHATENYVYSVEHGTDRVKIHPLPVTSNFEAATHVIGRPNFTSKGAASTSTGLNSPIDVWSDDQYIIIADRGNNRVVIHNSFPSLNTGEQHDVVVGQVDFNSNSSNQGASPDANTLSNPHAVFYDGKRLYIADSGNHRVLVFNSMPTSNNASADYVIGQQDFTSNSDNQGGSVNANTLNKPTDVDYDIDCGCLIITDQQNHRVLIYK